MEYVATSDRTQMEMVCLEAQIEPDNPVRYIGAFVDKLDLEQLEFQLKALKNEGRPAFHPTILLKLYFYGYLNGIRSSRKLEKECRRNVELHWLLCKLAPNYHTIADFRKVNPTALKNTFKLFVLFLRDADLVAGKTVAIDGTKFRAHNSKKNNYNTKKIQRHLVYIEEKTNEYLSQLDDNDAQESPQVVKEVKKKLQRLKQNKIKYQALGNLLETSGEPQKSTTDPDARALLVQGQVVEVYYNQQAAVDDKHKLVVGTHTINRNDRNALTDIATEAKKNLHAEHLTALVDKGYHNGRELDRCWQNNITTICATQTIVNSNNHGTTPAYLVSNFEYNRKHDYYICPESEVLISTGTWHIKTRERDSYKFKKYRTPMCNVCPVKSLCTGRAQGGREIERSEYADAVEANALRYKQNPDLYRKRQEWNEHIFGTIKRVWGSYYTNLKGLEKVNGEMSLIMTVYNIKRVMNILTYEDLKQKIRNWKPKYKAIAGFLLKTTSTFAIQSTIILQFINPTKKLAPLRSQIN